MQSTNGAMDSSWNSDPNPEPCRNSSPRCRLWNLDPSNGAILTRKNGQQDSHKAYFDSAFAENARGKIVNATFLHDNPCNIRYCLPINSQLFRGSPNTIDNRRTTHSPRKR